MAALVCGVREVWLYVGGVSSTVKKRNSLPSPRGFSSIGRLSPRALSSPAKKFVSFSRLARISKLRRTTLTPRLKYTFRVGVMSGVRETRGSERMGERRPRVP